MSFNVEEFLAQLDSGNIRAAEPNADGSWTVRLDVKQGILEVFKAGVLTQVSAGQPFQFFDKNTLPLKHLSI